MKFLLIGCILAITNYYTGFVSNTGIVPTSYSEGMFSWFPVYIPIKVGCSTVICVTVCIPVSACLDSCALLYLSNSK